MKPKAFYQQAEFILSCPSIKGAPNDEGFEVVFAGRSNAGKSSVINTLTSQKKLAKVSKTPGRTQHLVYFKLSENRRLVDLPGYGYAKVPIAVKKQWHLDMGEYFAKRSSLCGAILVMDIRHPMSLFDVQMLGWSATQQVPVHILLTKADKLSRGAAQNTKFEVEKMLVEKELAQHVSVQTFSSLNKQGSELAWHHLDKLLSIDEVV